MAIPVAIIGLIVAGTSTIAAGATLTKDKPIQSSKPNNRRTRDDYTSTSFDMVPTFGTRPIAPIKPIPAINNISNLQMIKPVYEVAPIAPIDPGQYRHYASRNVNPLYNYYTDPYQVNSMMDVWFNKAGRDLVLKDTVNPDIDIIPDNIPLIGKLDDVLLKPVNYIADTIAVGADYLKRSYVDPFAKALKDSNDSYTLGSAFAETGINALMASGEDLDIIANPIKGLILDGPKGFVRGVGVGDEGRAQYDYNVKTGNGALDFVGNLAAETASDPLNWITFGGKSLIKSGIKETAARALKETGVEVTEEVVEDFSKKYAKTLLHNAFAKEEQKELVNAASVLYKSGMDKGVARDVLNQVKEAVAYYNTKNIVKSTTAITQKAMQLDDIILRSTPIGQVFVQGGNAAKKIGSWATSVALNNIKRYNKTIRSFEDATVINPNTFKSENIIKSIEHEQDINYILGKRPKDLNVPTDDILVTKFQEYKMYEDNKTVNDFITELKTNNVITEDVAENLRNNKEFLDYYEDSIVPQGSALENLYKAILNDKKLIKVKLYNKMADQPTRVHQIAAANDAWKELFSDGTTSGYSLKEYNDIINGRLNVLKTQLENTSIHDVYAVQSIKGDILYWTGIKEVYDDMLKDLNLTLDSIPDLKTIKALLEVSDPAKAIDDALNGEQGYNTLLKKTRYEYSKNKNILNAVGATLYDNVQDITKALEVRGVEIQGVDAKRRYRAAEDLLMSKAYNNDEDIKQLLREYIQVGGDLAYYEQYYSELNYKKLESFLMPVDINNKFADTKASGTFFEMFENADELPAIMKNVAELQEDISKYKHGVDELNNLKSLLETNTLIRKTNDKTLSTNITKIKENAINKSIELYAKNLKDVSIQEIKPGTAVHDQIYEVVKALGLNKVEVLEDLEDAIIDNGGVVYLKKPLSLSTEQYNDMLKTFEKYKKVHPDSVITFDEYVSGNNHTTVVSGATINGITFTRDEILDLNKLVELLANPKQKDYEEIIDILNKLGYLDYNTDDLRIVRLTELDPSQKYYIQKENNLYTILDILEEYENRPHLGRIINDLVTGNSTTPTGTLLNIVEKVNTDSLIFNTKIVGSIKKDAKAQYNFSNLINKVMSVKDNKEGINTALLDLMGAYNYRSIDEFMDAYSIDGVTIDIEKLAEGLSFKKNGLVYSGTLKLGNLHEYYGLGSTAEIGLHNAAVDVKADANIFMEQLNRKYANLKDNEIFTVFDLETTGTELDGTNQVLQVYGHKYQKVGNTYKDLGSFQEIIKLNNPNKEISNEVKNVIGYDLVNAVSKSKVSEDEALERFLDFVGDSTLVGHNSNEFDIPFLEQRIGYKLDNKRYDTLVLAKKGINYNEIDLDAVEQLAGILTSYFKEQREYSNLCVKLVDSTTLNNLYDLCRELMSATGSRFINSNLILNKLKGNILEEALTEMLGKTVVTNFEKGLNPELGQELLSGIQNGLEVTDGDSLVVAIRNILTQKKADNQAMKHQYISSDDIKRMAGFQTNAFAYMNTNLKDNGYVLNRYALKRVYNSSYMQDVNAIYNKLQDNKEVANAFKTIIDANTDIKAKCDADDVIARIGSNEEQAARLYYGNELVKHGATAETNLNDIGNAVIAHGTDEIGKIDEEIREYTGILAGVNKKETDVYSNMYAILQTKTILEADINKLAAFMFDLSPRLRIGNMFNEHYAELVDNIIKNKELYEANGILVRVDGDTLILDLAADRLDDLTANSKLINRDYGFKNYRVAEPTDIKTKKLLEKQNELFEKANRIRKNPLPFNAHNFASNNMYADTWRAIYNNMPKYENTLSDNAEFMSAFFKTRDPHQTFINLGDMPARKMFDKYQQDPFRATVTQLQKNIQRVDGTNKFIELNFTKDLAMSGPMFRNLSDQELLDIFESKSKDYVVMVLTTDKAGKPLVRKFRPRTVSQIAKLKELDGVIAPNFYADKVVGTINKRELNEMFSSPIVQFYYKYILSTFKSLYLASFGMVARNLNDILIKNTMGGTIDDVPDTVLSFGKAMQDWQSYNTAVRDIMTSHAGTFNAETIADYFSKNPKISRDLFDEVHEYATSNVSAGMATAQEESLKSFYIKGKSSKFDQIFFDNAIRRWTIDKVMDVNTLVEHAGRLSNLRTSKANGLNYIDAYNKVLRTHFDYGVKSKGMRTAELIIPFITFPLYNLQYWIDAAFESPWLVEMLIDASRTSLESEAHKQFTLDNSNKLQSALLNGNVLIGGMLWKVNPSMFDAINLLTNPVGEAQQRTLTPIKALTEGVLKGTGILKEKEQEYVSNTVTNLDKLGFGDLEKTLNDKAGLYTLTRLANNVVKGIALLDNKMGTDLVPNDLEVTNSIADVIPSMAQEYKNKYGAHIGENFDTIKTTLNSGVRYNTVQTQTGLISKSTFYPTKYPNVKKTSGRSYNRIPYAKRYYSGSYNTYNRWKASRVTARSISTPASAESLQYVFKGLLYDLGMNPKIIRMYNLKQRGVYKVK